ncbi:MAG: hypothetical protein A3C80_02290 [Candidatus Ryanbacteria bacterium RIFCSPHIGHO2_02_FULL_45_43]|uniref:Amino acid transporter transmembrane domain-containing protein n=1 Tax=Candidatus Ryanbacteria bacterium RIFCSPHIGHO2_01_45_13 TaxID=1802112 RepID=A0A1G2FWI7_9BACT|nr:MAG: hypothetical protein A2718_00720 [Candidatus Ryanbacteria bacterium RIFCSPHIGHO2_01_FULL_44_130]OGZ42435.1 MAG: hypothetical protein A2W41_03565 [Candidatus Ryanbacteria bacterium RIFCSPHIGHO2_01_45_13]OGZ48452.1 MAG: hypothetical protein A3C80_02290 [Candidatus Ryanbacteria bacterium RIFCSPHIGHO2_02_FULL_45_43]OGZ50317.1 MAG: hypothetical protein A3E55_00190 [Candidatus Ryanbacteria bacterium RIFCSPHIGHO2_12_FULL_44_20]OGZ51656.1 MAG: hypothetical protein A3A17_02640 [Candidatus Ryanba
MINGRAIDSLGLLVGMIVGAGMFAIPYVVSRAGLLLGSIYLLLGVSVVAVLHTLYGEVVYVIKERHRLPGYARLCLGAYAGGLATFSMVFGFFGTLLAYGLLMGIFLQQLMGFGSAAINSLLFFVAAPFFLLFDLERVGFINFILTIPLLLFVFLLGLVALPHIDFSDVPLINSAQWFLPYGVFLFSFSGAAAIPEIAEMLKKREGRLFEKIVFLGAIIPAVVYAVFMFAVVGVSGGATTSDAITGLKPFLGGNIVFLGALIGLLAVFTSYLALGLDLRNALSIDYKFGKARSWLLIFIVPLLLFIIGASNLIRVIGLVGGVMIGINGILILALARHIRKYYKHPKGFIPIGTVVPQVVMALFALGIVWQIFTAL